MNNTETKPDSALLVTSVLEGKACEPNEALPGTSPSSLRTGFFIPLLLPHHQDRGNGNGGKKCTSCIHNIPVSTWSNVQFTTRICFPEARKGISNRPRVQITFSAQEKMQTGGRGSGYEMSS